MSLFFAAAAKCDCTLAKDHLFDTRRGFDAISKASLGPQSTVAMAERQSREAEYREVVRRRTTLPPSKSEPIGYLAQFEQSQVNDASRGKSRLLPLTEQRRSRPGVDLPRRRHRIDKLHEHYRNIVVNDYVALDSQTVCLTVPMLKRKEFDPLPLPPHLRSTVFSQQESH